MIGLENKIQLLSAKNISHWQRHKHWKWKIEYNIPSNRTQKQEEVAVFTSDKADLKSKLVTKDKGNLQSRKYTSLYMNIYNVYAYNEHWYTQFHKTNAHTHNRTS
jgi:hypothetical protein